MGVVGGGGWRPTFIIVKFRLKQCFSRGKWNLVWEKSGNFVFLALWNPEAYFLLNMAISCQFMADSFPRTKRISVIKVLQTTFPRLCLWKTSISYRPSPIFHVFMLCLRQKHSSLQLC